jgi:enolase-phosphatase E1
MQAQTLDRSSVGAILLDIEGTTTPIAFVTDVLFPYARRGLRAYVEAHLESAHLQEPIERLHDEWLHDVERGEHPPEWHDEDRAQRVASIVAYGEWSMDRDRKAFGLKAIQGYIWTRGYEDGTLRGEVYPDVPAAFARWRVAGIPIAIYSSGSTLGQQMLFRTTAYGDLTRDIRAHFDTGVGPKRSAESYRRIASALGLPPARVVFVSDVPAETAAAREAGFVTRLCVRASDVGPSVSVETVDEPAIADFNALL